MYIYIYIYIYIIGVNLNMVFETKNTCKVALYARKNFVPRYGHIYIFS